MWHQHCIVKGNEDERETSKCMTRKQTTDTNKNWIHRLHVKICTQREKVCRKSRAQKHEETRRERERHACQEPKERIKAWGRTSEEGTRRSSSSTWFMQRRRRERERKNTIPWNFYATASFEFLSVFSCFLLESFSQNRKFMAGISLSLFPVTAWRWHRMTNKTYKIS